jgi:hypothetical protein
VTVAPADDRLLLVEASDSDAVDGTNEDVAFGVTTYEEDTDEDIVPDTETEGCGALDSVCSLGTTTVEGTRGGRGDCSGGADADVTPGTDSASVCARRLARRFLLLALGSVAAWDSVSAAFVLSTGCSSGNIWFCNCSNCN